MTSLRRTGLLLALATACISGFAVFLNGYGVKAVGNPTVYTTAKNLVAAVILIAIATLGRSMGARLTRPASRGQWAGLLAVGIVGGSVPFVLFFEGLSRASSTQAAFLHKTLVLWVAILAIAFLKERLQVWHWVAIALLIVGQAGLAGGVTTSLATGEGMIFAATLLWAVEVTLAKKLLGGLSSWTLGCARMGFGSVALVAWVLVKGDGAALVSLSAAGWGWALLTGLILAGYVGTWFAALARAQAVDVTAVLVLAAPITAALNAAVNGTAIAPQAAWLALVVAGGALVVTLAWRRPALQPAPQRGGAAAAG